MRIKYFFLSLILFFANSALADQTLFITAQIRANATASIKTEILTNPNLPSGGRTILIHHGLAHSGNAVKPLAQKIFADATLSAKVSNIVIINLPGRNGSPLPQGVLFGDLSMVDYASIFLSVLDGLNNQNIHVDSIVGHSMGAVVVELAQNKLLAQGKDLKTDYGIENVVLMAPSIPREIPWLISDSQLSTILALPNIRFSFSMGTFVDIPTLLWQNLWFTTRLYVIYSPTTPSIFDIQNLGYISKEAYQASAEVIGVLGYQRPSVGSGIFNVNKGINFRLVAFSEDRNASTSEERNLYRHVTNDPNDQRYTIVTRPDAVHDMLISSPQGLIDAGIFSDF